MKMKSVTVKYSCLLLLTRLDVKSLLQLSNSYHETSIITLIELKNSKKSVPEESKIAFELFKQLRKAHIMVSSIHYFLVLQYR